MISFLLILRDPPWVTMRQPGRLLLARVSPLLNHPDIEYWPVLRFVWHFENHLEMTGDVSIGNKLKFTAIPLRSIARFEPNGGEIGLRREEVDRSYRLRRILRHHEGRPGCHLPSTSAACFTLLQQAERLSVLHLCTPVVFG